MEQLRKRRGRRARVDAMESKHVQRRHAKHARHRQRTWLLNTHRRWVKWGCVVFVREDQEAQRKASTEKATQRGGWRALGSAPTAPLPGALPDTRDHASTTRVGEHKGRERRAGELPSAEPKARAGANKGRTADQAATYEHACQHCMRRRQADPAHPDQRWRLRPSPHGSGRGRPRP